MELTKKDIEDLKKQGYTKKQIDDALKEVAVEEKDMERMERMDRMKAIREIYSPPSYQPQPIPEPSFRINVHVYFHDKPIRYNTVR